LGANFDNTTFEQRSSFEKAEFYYSSFFKETKFNKKVVFSKARSNETNRNSMESLSFKGAILYEAKFFNSMLITSPKLQLSSMLKSLLIL